MLAKFLVAGLDVVAVWSEVHITPEPAGTQKSGRETLRRSETQISRQALSKTLKPTLPRVLSRANASVVDEE